MTEIEQQPVPERTSRHYLGVTSSGLRVGTVITANFPADAPYKPVPMSALRGDDAFGRIMSGLVEADDSPLLWPVGADVYRAFYEDEDEPPNSGWDLDDDEDDDL